MNTYTFVICSEEQSARSKFCWQTLGIISVNFFQDIKMAQVQMAKMAISKQ